jgi:uncharacterized membrane protein YhdT
MEFALMGLIVIYGGVYFIANIFENLPFFNGLRRCFIIGSTIELVILLGILIYNFFKIVYLDLNGNDTRKIELDLNYHNFYFSLFLSMSFLIVGLLLKIIEGQKNEK